MLVVKIFRPKHCRIDDELFAVEQYFHSDDHLV